MLQRSPGLVPPPTNWPLVFALILAGVIAACQVGKAAIAVPLLRHDLGLGLVAVSWVVGAYGALGAFGGLPAGIVVTIIGPRRALLLGLFTIGCGSALGAFADNAAILLATRVLEGLGFLAVAIAIPTLLRGVTAPRDRDLAFTCWSAYMPAGTAIMMLVGPLFATSGWQGLWLANGLLAGAYALLMWIVAPAGAAPAAPDRDTLANIGAVVRAPGPVLLALAFGAYTFQYFALTAFLPILLVERMGLTIAQAGALSAGAVVANALGNLAAGALLHLGVPLWMVVAAAFTCVGLASFGIFADTMPVALVAALASASLGITGLVPASIFAATPRLATSSHALAITLGLIVQASNIGQLVGPAALGAWIERFGWSHAPLLFVVLALAGWTIALGLRALLRRD